MEWLNEPASWQRTAGVLSVSVDPGTDFWRETGYGHIRDSGHVYGTMLTGDLDVWVHLRAGLADQYDQAGIMLRADSRTWLKTGLELFEGRPRLSTVVTLGQSSWMVASLPEGTYEISLRVSRRGDGVQVRYLVGDGPLELAALAYLPPDAGVLAGVMCACPEGNGFSVSFRDLRIGGTEWEGAVAGDVAAGDVAADEMAAGDVAAGDVAADEMAAGDVAAGDVAADEVAAVAIDEIAAGDPGSEDDRPAGVPGADEDRADGPWTGKASDSTGPAGAAAADTGQPQPATDTGQPQPATDTGQPEPGTDGAVGPAGPAGPARAEPGESAPHQTGPLPVRPPAEPAAAATVTPDPATEDESLAGPEPDGEAAGAPGEQLPAAAAGPGQEPPGPAASGPDAARWDGVPPSARMGHWAASQPQDAARGWSPLPDDLISSSWPGPPTVPPGTPESVSGQAGSAAGPDSPVGEHTQAGEQAAAGPEPGPGAGDPDPDPGPAQAEPHAEGQPDPGPATTGPGDLPPFADDPTDPNLPAATADPPAAAGHGQPGPPRPRAGDSAAGWAAPGDDHASRGNGPRQSTRVLGGRDDADAAADEWISLLRSDPSDD